MSMRISSASRLSVLLPLLLAGCGQSTPGDLMRKIEAQTVNQAAEKGDVLCARSGETELRMACTIDRTTTDEGLILTVRHPDGAFHRLLVTKDGRGVVAADGAEHAEVTIIGSHQIDVALGGDRYRLPATVGGTAKTAP